MSYLAYNGGVCPFSLPPAIASSPMLCRPLIIRLPVVWLVTLGWLGLSSAWSDSPEAENSLPADFFETRIRPVLIEHCYACHSVDALNEGDLQAGLFVDSRDGLHRGGDSGPAVVPNDPQASLLLQAMLYEDYEMPPEGKLEDHVLDDFRRWISAGAPDPRVEQPSADRTNSRLQQAASHWAYQPLMESVPAAGSEMSTGHTRIDDLLQQTWEPEIEPAGLANRSTLLRRVTFDLTGLPPTTEDLAAFMDDHRPDAYQRLVDRLLASPSFGEHWGRHWLDLARFSESVTLRGLVQAEAWRYRDYVIDAWNRGLPYDRFVMEQLAGDLLDASTLEDRQRQSIATGFLTLGNHNLEDQDKHKLDMDAVDEQLRVIGGAFLGQTLGCARCHDHKFDPISTREYYALAGILSNVRMFEHANVSRWVEKPLPMDPQTRQAVEEHQAAVRELSQAITAIEKDLGIRANGAKSVKADSLAGHIFDNDRVELTGEWTTSTSSPKFVGGNYLHDGRKGQGEKQVLFKLTVPSPGRYSVRLSYSPGSNRATNTHVKLHGAEQPFETRINQRKAPDISGLFVELGVFSLSPDRPVSLVISNDAADGHVIADAVQLLAETQLASEQREVSTDNSEAELLKADLAKKKQALKELQQEAPVLERYMGVIESDTINDMAVNIRGNVHRYGDPVPRGVLSVALGECEIEMPTDESGRLQLAQWIADPSNPLTARVMANRLWGWLCGEWIVRSPNNFGTTGENPTHPELLDHLASELIDHEWAMKPIIRQIVLSETYRRDSRATDELQEADPENLFWYRAKRKRLAAEAIMDAMQMSADQLDSRISGKTVPAKLSADYDFKHQVSRRTVYWPAFRNARPEILEVFDGANPSLSTGRRDSSTVPPQALYMMNSPVVLELSRQAAQELLSDSFGDDTQRVEHLYKKLLSRSPTTGELQSILAFAESAKTEPLEKWTDIVQAIFCTIDYQYLR